MGAVTAIAGDPVALQLRRMSGLRFVPERLDTHVEALADVAIEDLSGAISIAQRECRDFPTPSELLEFVHRVRVSRVASAPDPIVERRIDPVDVSITHAGETVARVRVTHEYDHECETCDDSGWRPVWCGIREAMPVVLQMRAAQYAFCGIRREHGPHEFMVECSCRPHNRAYQLSRERLAAGARKRTEGAK